MPEPEQTKSAKTKNPDAPPRTLAARVERSLKDVDRLLKRSPEVPAQQRTMMQLEQAKAAALLELADAIRASKRG